jgi:DNA-binding response OmpR family regulator
VLFVTGYADKFELEEGSDPLIMKPFKPASLAEAVRNALRGAPSQRGRQYRTAATASTHICALTNDAATVGGAKR